MMNKRETLAAALLAIASLSACTPKTPAPETLTVADYSAPDLLALSLPELTEKLRAGDVSAEALTQAYISRIDALNNKGPELNAVLALNPSAMDDARAIDIRRARGETLGPLQGVPILLKDNIESKDYVATTAGALALAENITRRDAPLVAGLRAADGVILGKANLSQWANFRSSHSMSGWSALGGQVRNPHSLDRNPCGSSSGSGAGVAASLAAGAVGTETNGSIICPSTINGVVGFKPTVGLVSQQHIIPISASQDTAGPMTKTVRGAAMMLDAMDSTEVDYAAALDGDSLRGTRIGVLRFADGNHPDIEAQFNRALEVLTQAGAVLVEIESFDLGVDNYGQKSRAVLDYEFKDGLNAYLSTTPDTVSSRTLFDVIAFNTVYAEVELPLFGQDILEDAQARGPLSDATYIDAAREVKRATGVDGIDRLLRDHDVSVLVAPSGPLPGRIDPVNGDVWPSWAGAGYLAAVAGYPHLSVPMGTVRGLPIGLSFMGTASDDAAILSYGYSFEQQSQRVQNMSRVAPQFRESAEDIESLSTAMRPHKPR